MERSIQDNGTISKNAARRLTDKAAADLRDYWTDAK
jgi:hypothetical protein